MLGPADEEGKIVLLRDAAFLRHFEAADPGIVVDAVGELDGQARISSRFDVRNLAPRNRTFDNAAVAFTTRVTCLRAFPSRRRSRWPSGPSDPA